jgi:competence protein ComEC
MKRPFLLPVLGCASGILCGWYASASLTWLWIAAWLVLLVGFGGWKQRGIVALLLCLIGGWINTTTRTGIHSPNDLRLRVGTGPMLTTVKGTIVENPVVSQSFSADVNEVRWRTMIAVQKVSERGQTWPADGRLLVFSEGPIYRELVVGTEVTATGVIRRPSVAPAPGLFDYREKLRREGVFYQLETAQMSDWRVIRRPERPPLQERFRRWAQARLADGQIGEDESLRLLWAMVLGWRAALTDEVAESFMQSGTMHIFAISGLHVAIIAGVLMMLLRVARLPRAACGLLVVPALWFYCAATGWQPSATRATLMMSIVVGGWALNRPVDLLNSVCTAAFVILLWDPLQLLQASFQLSFAVVTTIAILLPRFDGLRDRLLATDPLLPAELLPWWRRCLLWVGRWGFAALALSLCAWLGSLPLIGFYFQLWTPGCLLANPIVVLCATGAICSAMGGLLLAPIIPPVAVLFNHSAWFWVASQTWISRQVAELPGGWWSVSGVSLSEVVLYYGILLGIGCRWIGGQGWRRGYAVFCALCVAFLVADRVGNSQKLVVSVLGQSANIVFCDFPGQKEDLLIDCGRKEGFRRVLDPYLKTRGVTQIPRLVLTHGDAAHVESFAEMNAEFEIRTVHTSPVRQLSPGYRRIVEGMPENDADWSLVARGDRIGRWSVLHPGVEDTVFRADDAAIVLRGEFSGVRLLLISDLGPIGQARLIAASRDLSADILICGVSSAGGVVGDELLSAIGARLLIVQDNRFPIGDRISRRDLSRLQSRVERVINLSESGSVALTISSENWQVVQTQRGP